MKIVPPDVGPELDLTEIDRNTPLWRAIHRYYTAQLERLRAQNDMELDPVKTAALRGRIAEVKALLAHDEPAPTVTK